MSKISPASVCQIARAWYLSDKYDIVEKKLMSDRESCLSLESHLDQDGDR